MSNQKNPNWKARWKGATIIAAVTVFLDLSVLFLGTHSIKGLISLSIPWSVGSIGIITFVGILLHVNYLSNDTELSKREMRKAIAASLIAVYCTLVPLIIFELPNFTNDKQFELATTAIADFSWVIGAVIVFYFGSRSVDKWIDYKKGEQAQSGATAETVPESTETEHEEDTEPQSAKQKPSSR